MILKNNIMDEQPVLEPWVDRLKLTTHKAQAFLETLHVADWVASQRARQCQWGGHVTHMVFERWAKLVAAWNPSEDENMPKTTRFQ